MTGEVSYDGLRYSMPPQAAGMAGTLYLYRDVVHIVAGRYEAELPGTCPTETSRGLPSTAPRTWRRSAARAGGAT